MDEKLTDEELQEIASLKQRIRERVAIQDARMERIALAFERMAAAQEKQAEATREFYKWWGPGGKLDGQGFEALMSFLDYLHGKM